ncbi:hypothetical protein [Alkalicoccus daliensis]|uniref:Uncharacterized protein n=1 Tax=Alkalicoccus daliensis TaxID=745820 RepID=A0A1H0J5H7_9BACI|nr:hypothetical protein [Alkalicoccus daliensis]SDO38729.1 hypothetical protein SAMN04488053_11272 [Alkalicoccus daliensis]
MPLHSGSYHQLKEAAVTVLHRLSDLIDVNTIYIARTTEEETCIQHVYNSDKVLMQEGLAKDYTNSF